MLLIGSTAMKYFNLVDRQPIDTDVIGSPQELKEQLALAHETDCIYYPLKGNKYVFKYKPTLILEFEIAWEGSTSEELLKIVTDNALYTDWEGMLIASPEVLLTLKLSHRYLKNSPYFLKTMKDIHTLRNARYSVPECLKDWLTRREQETYNYSHPKLNQTKKDFFDTEGVKYEYDHDSLHRAVALGDRPAYEFYKKDGQEVMCSKELWDKCSEEIKLAGVYEEACVLALERCLIPFQDIYPPPKQAFLMALEKVCTSITSGWFREYAWENYYRVKDMWKGDLMEKFIKGKNNGIIKYADV